VTIEVDEPPPDCNSVALLSAIGADPNASRKAKIITVKSAAIGVLGLFFIYSGSPFLIRIFWFNNY